MDLSLCEQVRHYIQTAIRLGDSGPPPALLVDHIVGCNMCRGALALLAATVLPELPAAHYTSCDSCRADLAAFIDLERQGYAAEAARIYPHVWWHLWVCPTCAEEYQLILMLSEAMPDGPPLRVGLEPGVMRPTRRRIDTITLSRSFLHSALVSRAPAVGQARGKRAHAMVLAEEEYDGYQINIRVQQQPDTQWCVLVAVVPPITGWLVMTLGELVVRARFDDDSESQIPDLPYEVLAGADGPDLALAIEYDSDTTEDDAAHDAHP